MCGISANLALCAATLLLPHSTVYSKDKNTADVQKTQAAVNMHFIENRGQITDQYHNRRTDIDYKISDGNVNMFVGDGQIHYQWNKVVKKESKETPAKIESYRLDVVLVGANKNAVHESSDKQPYYEMYYKGGQNGFKAESYNRVVYRNVYPNIDWVLYSGDKGVKYDFVVHPGGKVSDIKLRYEGATSLSLKDGMVIAGTPMGTVSEQMPYSYILDGNKEVASSFVLNGNELSFNVGSYDGTLVIDPVLNWSTYYCNPAGGEGRTSSVDTAGYVYLCGTTTEGGNVATFLAHDDTYDSNGDAYIVRFGIDGVTRMWATYIGAEGLDVILTSVVDRDNNLIVAGYTSSTSAITNGVGIYQSGNGGDAFNGNSLIDGFVNKFNKDGGRIWGTYYGGQKIDIINTVAVDYVNNIYIGGYTNSSNGVSIALNGYSTVPNDGFFAKLVGSTGGRSWGSYFPGEVLGIAADKDEIGIVGKTNSTTGVSSNTTFNGGSMDGYVAKFSNGGGSSSLKWSRYFGGGDYDAVNAIVFDSLRNAYVAGVTQSGNNIATTGTLYPAHSDGSTPASYDAFIARLDYADGQKKWGTYYGGSLAHDVFYGLYLGPDQKIYAAGQTGSSSNISTAGAYQSGYSGPPPSPVPPPPAVPIVPDGDAFLTKFTPDGKRVWGTYFGGAKFESHAKVAYGKGKVYLSGTSGSKTIAVNGYQTVLADTANGICAYLAQFQADTSVYIRFPYTDTSLCEGQAFNVNYRVTNAFLPGNVFSVQLSDLSGSFATLRPPLGTIASIDGGVIACTVPTGLTEGKGYKLRIVSTMPRDTFYAYDIPIRISKYYKPDIIGTSPLCLNSNLELRDLSPAPASQVNYKWTAPNGTNYYSNPWILGQVTSSAFDGDYILEIDNYGCKATDTVNVELLPSPANPIITGDTTICTGETLKLNAIVFDSDLEYQWRNQSSTLIVRDTQLVVPNMQPSDEGYYRLLVRKPLGCAADEMEVYVKVYPLPQPSAGHNTPICVGDTIRLTSSDTMSNVSYSWTGPNGFSSGSKDTSFVSYLMGQSGPYTVTTVSPYGCKQTAVAQVQLKPMPEQVEAQNNGPVCDGADLRLITNNATAGATYTWTGPGGFTSTEMNPPLGAATLSMSGEYRVVADLEGCKTEDTTIVTVYPTPDTPRITSNSPLLVGKILLLKILNPQPGVNYSWTGPNGFISTQRDPVINSVVPSMAGLYTVVASIANCSNYDTATIVLIDPGKEAEKAVLVLPNPNNGIFKLQGITATNADIPILVYASDGKLIMKDVAYPKNNKVDHTVDISNRVSNGVYRVKIRVDGKEQVVSISIKQ